MTQNKSHAVMAQRHEAPDSLDFFPTPPWATRALAECVLPGLGLSLYRATVWEPACGEGHMAHVLAEYAGTVIGSDVHDYGVGSRIGSFVGAGSDVIDTPPGVDWIITNPPFNLAVEFVERGLRDAEHVAVLTRSVWLESADRYLRLFSKHPPLAVAQFCERVPMIKGRWDPKASTATSYAWIIWAHLAQTRFMWIPPGQRARLTQPDDGSRFAARVSEPLP